MLKRFASRLVLNFRVVMLVVTSLFLFLGGVSVYDQLNWSEPYVGLVAVEGENFVHLTTDGSGHVERQSKIVRLSREELLRGDRQMLIAMEGKAFLDGDIELVISWSSEPAAARQRYLERAGPTTVALRPGATPDPEGRTLLYEIRQRDKTVAIWFERFDDYGGMFQRAASDLGLGGRFEVTYQAQIPSQADFETGSLSVVARRVPTPVSFYIVDAVGFMFLLVGFVVYFSGASRRVPHATHFFLICLAFFVSFVYQFTNSGATLAWVIFWIDKVAFLATPVVLLHFLYLFSRDRFSSPWTIKTASFYLPAALLLLADIFLLNYNALPFGAGPMRVSSFPEFYSLLRKVEVVAFSAFVFAGLALLWRAFRETSSVEKKIQIKWLFWGVGLGMLPTIMLSYPLFILDMPTDVVNVIVGIPLSVLPVCFAFAVFRYKLMDVEVVFKRGFVYLISSFTVVALYILLMFGLDIFGGSLGTPILVVVSVVMILLATLFSHRLKDQVQSIFDRVLDRNFYYFRRTLQRFSQELSYERDLDRLLAKIAERIRETFSVPVVMIFTVSPDKRHFLCGYSSVPEATARYLSEKSSDWLRERLRAGKPVPLESIGKHAASEAFRDSGVTTMIPFLSLGEVIGFLALGNKADGDILNSDDLELLSSLAGRAAAAVDNATLYLDLQRRAEELRGLKEFSDSIVESIDSGVCVVDKSGRVQRWNSALEEITGISREEAMGTQMLDLLPPAMAGYLRPYMLGQGDDSGVMRSLYKLKVPLADGDEKVLNISFAPLGEVDGFSGTVFIIDDITEWVSMENQMMQRDRLTSLGLLAAGVAHEVNTPLTGISSYTQMLARKFASDEEAKRLLKKVESQAHRASKIINSLLNFSRGATTSEKSNIDLNSLIRESLSLIENQLSALGVIVTTDFEADLDTIIGDRGKLQQVLINLLLNARDSMPDGGEIRITTRNRGDHITCAVADNGMGIPDEDIGRIYDPFFTTKKTGKGTGLGLSVSYGIIQEHSGTIDVESEVGVGTTFIISLPVRRKVEEDRPS